MKQRSMTMKENQEAFVEKSAEYLCVMNEIKTDMEIFTERLRVIEHPFIANKFDTIGAIIKCANDHIEALTASKIWKDESKVA